MLKTEHSATQLRYTLGITAEDYARAPQSHDRILHGSGAGWRVAEVFDDGQQVHVSINLPWRAERTKQAVEQWLFLRVDEARAECSRAKLIDTRYEELGKKIGLL